MTFTLRVIAIASLLLYPVAVNAQNTMISSVDPLTAKVGDSVNAQGQGLAANKVDQMYLTNGTDDIRVEIVDQQDKVIKFKVPAGIKSGRWALMIHLKVVNGPTLIEQPVKLTVE
jgi:hypothetical protein